MAPVIYQPVATQTKNTGDPSYDITLVARNIKNYLPLLLARFKATCAGHGTGGGDNEERLALCNPLYGGPSWFA